MDAFAQFLESGDPLGEGRHDFRIESLAGIAQTLREADETAMQLILHATCREAAAVALALCASIGKTPLKRSALANLSQVCDTSERLFLFCTTLKGLRGWGRSLRVAIAKWYTDQSVEALSKLLSEGKPSGEWSHRDLLRLSHPRPRSPEQAAALRALADLR